MIGVGALKFITHNVLDFSRIFPFKNLDSLHVSFPDTIPFLLDSGEFSSPGIKLFQGSLIKCIVYKLIKKQKKLAENLFIFFSFSFFVV